MKTYQNAAAILLFVIMLTGIKVDSSAQEPVIKFGKAVDSHNLFLKIKREG